MTRLEMIMKQDIGYNPELKKEFQFYARKAFQALVKELNLPRGSYDLRYNPGGIAVSGDVILHTDQFYVCLSQQFLGGLDIFYRRCADREDYYGGPNHWARVADLARGGGRVLAEKIRSIL